MFLAFLFFSSSHDLCPQPRSIVDREAAKKERKARIKAKLGQRAERKALNKAREANSPKKAKKAKKVSDITSCV